MPHYLPVTVDALSTAIAERADAVPGPVLVAIDGADAGEPMRLADAVVGAARAGGGSAHALSMHDWVRPASLRFEYGRTDQLSYRTTWFDYDALAREVIGSVRAARTWLPALWDEANDRSARARMRTATDHEILVVAGPMLLGRDLGFDVTVSLVMDRAALLRRTPDDEHWTIDALAAHSDATTEIPDVTVRWNHPDRPAVLQ